MARRIDESTMRALIEAGVVREAVITRTKQRGGYRWAILIKYGMNTQTLCSQREPVRLFASIDTAAALLHDAGLHLITIDYG